MAASARRRFLKQAAASARRTTTRDGETRGSRHAHGRFCIHPEHASDKSRHVYFDCRRAAVHPWQRAERGDSVGPSQGSREQRQHRREHFFGPSRRSPDDCLGARHFDLTVEAGGTAGTAGEGTAAASASATARAASQAQSARGLAGVIDGAG